VLAFSYQTGYSDALYMRYGYDSDNRLRQAESSRDRVIWDRDALYSYYRHGPLARTELGTHHVQGLDYVYTLQGWLKGMNGAVGRDPGADGNSSGPRAHFARDAIHFSLGYYENDYRPANQRDQLAPGSYFELGTAGSDFAAAGPPLYNGNIRHMVTGLHDSLGAALPLQGTAYGYDQLNRLAGMRVFEHTAKTNSWENGVEIGKYRMDSVTYDANGNILTLARNGNKSTPDEAMDRLSYHYTPGSNRLTHVGDAVPAGRYANDIDAQQTDNYSYNAIGQLTADAEAGIAQIEWTLSGKVKRITRTAGSERPDLEFEYDAAGNRVKKTVIGKGEAPTTLTRYVRDAQGNVISTYDEDADGLWRTEQYLYGSARLGSYAERIRIAKTTEHPDTNRCQRTLGRKRYELTNHLGNVLSTVSDRKRAVAGAGGSIAYWELEVMSCTDYYPFGMQMAGRSFASKGYRYSFNGQEVDNEIKGSGNSINYKYRMYDPRIARFFAVDPIARRYPELSVYQHSSLNPIWKVEIEGLEGAEYRFRQYMKSQGGIQEQAEEHADQMHGEVAKQILRYGTPVEDAFGVITGRDFDGQPYNRGEAAAWGAASFIPFTKLAKLAKPVFKVAKGTSRIAGKVGNFGNKTLLNEHFIKHGDEFGGKFRNAEEYAIGAQNFFKREGDNVFEFVHENGEIVKFDKANNIFGVAKDDGTIKTIFKPDEGFDYFKDQLRKSQGDDAVKALDDISD